MNLKLCDLSEIQKAELIDEWNEVLALICSRPMGKEFVQSYVHNQKGRLVPQAMLEAWELYQTRNYSVNFPGELVFLEDVMSECQAEQDDCCALCGAPIAAGEACLLYHPTLRKHSDDQCYQLQRPILVKKACGHYLPQDIRDFEAFLFSVEDEVRQPGWNDDRFPNNRPHQRPVDLVYFAAHYGPVEFCEVGKANSKYGRGK